MIKTGEQWVTDRATAKTDPKALDSLRSRALAEVKRRTDRQDRFREAHKAWHFAHYVHDTETGDTRSTQPCATHWWSRHIETKVTPGCRIAHMHAAMVDAHRSAKVSLGLGLGLGLGGGGAASSPVRPHEYRRQRALAASGPRHHRFIRQHHHLGGSERQRQHGYGQWSRRSKLPSSRALAESTTCPRSTSRPAQGASSFAGANNLVASGAEIGHCLSLSRRRVISTTNLLYSRRARL